MTRARSASVTGFVLPLMILDAVAGETPARRATSAKVAMRPVPFQRESPTAARERADRAISSMRISKFWKMYVTGKPLPVGEYSQ